MSLRRTTIYTLAGILAGVLIVHPYVMLVDRLTGAEHVLPAMDGNFLSAFNPAMLPMTVAIGFFAGCCGLLLGLVDGYVRRIERYRFQAKLHHEVNGALTQLLGVLSHYILNSSMVISGRARHLAASARPGDRKAIKAIIAQAERNEAVLKLMQDADFLRRIDPSDTTYQKLIDLNRRVEEQLHS